jgi:predicted O-methyltransferase YrrM
MKCATILHAAAMRMLCLENAMRMRKIHSRLERVDAPDARHKNDLSWKLPMKKFPYSCTDEEGSILSYIIGVNKLVSGFEIATAFGFSSMYCGISLARNSGTLLSVDCYIEEFKEDYQYESDELQQRISVVRDDIVNGKAPEGLKFARESAKILGLQDTITFEIGISPQDMPDLVGNRTFDFVFIDGGHFGEQPLLDFFAVLPYLENKCVVCFHDNISSPVDAAVKKAEEVFKTSAIVFDTRYKLTVVGRGIDVASLVMARDLISPC